MKKVFIIAAMFAVMTASCTEERTDTMFEDPELVQTRYTSEQMSFIKEVYDFCLTFYLEEIPAYLVVDNPTTEEMLSVIRYCDLLDRGGDVFIGWDSYDMIKTILWPDGYGKEA